ncbi:MAG: hypothetical protein KF833_00885 [Verrucomicrobiae bacterium]|nr:hypothetical protein [Verrucomicrobiae bacterium]
MAAQAPPLTASPSRRFSRLPPRDRLQVAILINQLATPGLGSWLAGFRVAGLGQLILSISGFLLFLVFFGAWMLELGRFWYYALDEVHLPDPFWWQSSLLLFGAAWLWAAITSCQMFGQLRRLPRPPTTPPSLNAPPPIATERRSD